MQINKAPLFLVSRFKEEKKTQAAGKDKDTEHNHVHDCDERQRKHKHVNVLKKSRKK